MEISPLLFLGFLWFLFNLLRGTKTESGSKPRRPGPPRPVPPEPLGPPSRTPLPASSGLDATQSEGSRLEALLRDLNRSLEQVAQADAPSPTGHAGPDADDAIDEERESLEVVPETVSLETPSQRVERKAVDYDDSANQVAAKRLADAQARSGPQSGAGHRQFDERIRLDDRIRREPADHTAVRRYSGKQLRDAIVWREILGPPVALRDQEKEKR